MDFSGEKGVRETVRGTSRPTERGEKHGPVAKKPEG